jgi:sporulation protein YlmC with PRC-barrel domain
MSKTYSLFFALVLLFVPAVLIAQDTGQEVPSAPSAPEVQEEQPPVDQAPTEEPAEPQDETLGAGEEQAEPVEPEATPPAEEAPAEPVPQEQPEAQTDQTLGAGQTGFPEQAVISGSLVRLGQVQGTQVSTADGAASGTLEDFVLTPGGQVSHLVVGVGDIQGIQPGSYLIESQALQLQDSQVTIAIQDPSGLVPAADFRQAAPQSSILYSTLVGYRVINNQEQDLQATIVDVVANLQTGSIEYVAFDFSAAGLGAGQNLIAAPYDEVWYHLDNRTVRIDVSQDGVQNLQGFGQDSWPEQAQTGWNQGAEGGPMLGSGEPTAPAEEQPEGAAQPEALPPAEQGAAEPQDELGAGEAPAEPAEPEGESEGGETIDSLTEPFPDAESLQDNPLPESTSPEPEDGAAVQ